MIMSSTSSPSFLSRTAIYTVVMCSFLPSPLPAQTTGSSVLGGSVTGGSVTGGSVTGGSVTGGSVTGGSVTGGTVTGGTVTNGTVTPSTITPGTVTSGAVTAGTATANVAGRLISATSEGSITVQADGANATVKLGKHLLRIEKERLLLDGKERAKLPMSAAKVQVTVSQGRLTVHADDREVLVSDLDAAP